MNTVIVNSRTMQFLSVVRSSKNSVIFLMQLKNSITFLKQSEKSVFILFFQIKLNAFPDSQSCALMLNTERIAQRVKNMSIPSKMGPAIDN